MSPTFYYPIGRPQMVDLTSVDSSLKGFVGGFTDGRYGYFVPNYNDLLFGKVARLDLQNFTTGGVSVLNLEAVNAALKGFAGGFTDGRYGYFVPSAGGTAARVDLQNFTPIGVTVLNLAAVNGDLMGFQGGFTDGRYGYFVPRAKNKVARVDLEHFDATGVSWLDLSSSGAKGFQGGFTDGRYGYFVPFTDNGTWLSKVARVDLQNFTLAGVTVLDLADAQADLKGFFGGFTDGRYGYFVPKNNGAPFGKVVRVDLQNFTLSGVTWLDLSAVDGGLKGLGGGFTDGRYAYFAPDNNGAASGKMARVDLRNFTASGVTWVDFAAVDSGLQGFNGGFSDGRFGYFVPYANSAGHSGKVARIMLFFGGAAP